MKHKKAIKVFEELQLNLAEGKISNTDFERKVNEIVAESQDGAKWKVDIEGQWYKSINDEWIKKDLNQEETARAPESLFQFLILIVKSFFLNIPRLVKRLLIISALALIVHTYLVIYPNGGFAPSSESEFLNNVLALKGNKISGTIFWTIISYVITTAFYKIRLLGFKRFFSGVVKGPIRAIKSMNKKHVPFFAILTGVILLTNYFLIKNSTMAITIAIGAFFGIVVYRSSLGYIALKLGHSDINKLRKKLDERFDDRLYDIIQLSIVLSLSKH